MAVGRHAWWVAMPPVSVKTEGGLLFWLPGGGGVATAIPDPSTLSVSLDSPVARIAQRRGAVCGGAYSVVRWVRGVQQPTLSAAAVRREARRRRGLSIRVRPVTAGAAGAGAVDDRLSSKARQPPDRMARRSSLLAELWLATLSLTALQRSMAAEESPASWTEHDGQGYTCTADEYKGTVPLKAKTAAGCMAAAQAAGASLGIDFATYRPSDPGACYVCRVVGIAAKLRPVAGQVSFVGPLPPPPPPPPPPKTPPFSVGGITLQLADGTFTALQLNRSVAAGAQKTEANDFSFVGGVKNPPSQGCQMLGDLTIRVRPATAGAAGAGAGGTPWAIYDSAFAAESAWQGVKTATGAGANILAAHDITALLDSSATNANGSPSAGYNNSYFAKVPLRVVRSWEKAEGGRGIVLRFNLSNTWSGALELGGLGFPMPHAGMQKGIENSVWNDPHIGGDHGYVEWVKVVDDEDTLLATAAGSGSGMEAWRPLMESSCKNDHWSWEVFSKAWAAEWKENKQFPFMAMAPDLAQARSKVDGSLIWGTPHQSPWPAWHGRETVPLTDFEGIAAPWNLPTSATIAAGETRSFAIRLTIASKGPRTRDAALLQAGRSTITAVPGYVISADMTSAKLIVTLPAGVTLNAVVPSNASLIKATIAPGGARGTATVAVAALANGGRGRCRLALMFSDGSVNFVHYSVLPSLASQIEAVGKHWAEDAWLPLEYEDPFGRGASVMPYDRHERARVLDDSRAYDVGLSDDAGGGNPLGFAIKVAYAPTQLQVQRLDDYVKWTLFGVKTPDNCPKCGAKAPFKSLQIRPEDCDPEQGDAPGNQCGHEDGIRMTMYYYNMPSAGPPPVFDFNSSGHFPYSYPEADKVGAPGLEGGPNWPMNEGMANATYRAFNFPHHVTTYLSLYYAARNTQLKTYLLQSHIFCPCLCVSVSLCAVCV